MDILKQSAVAFEKLLKYEYQIIAGSKKTLLKLTLFFSKEQFMHLIGLHKLTDLQLQRVSRAKLYDMIMQDELTYDYIQKSVFFPEIEDRIRMFTVLEGALDSNEIMIKYKRGLSGGTTIDASYIIIYRHEDTIIHFFIGEDHETHKYFGKSFFTRTDDKFLKNQQTFKILKKFKIDKILNTVEILKDKNLIADR